MEPFLENYLIISFHRGSYTSGIGDASSFYNSWSGYQDELIWGAAWVAKATGNANDLARGKSSLQSGGLWIPGSFRG